MYIYFFNLKAHGLGEGRYRQIFGNRKENSQVFLEHLQRVSQICKNLGKTPLIWSDSKNFKIKLNNIMK